MPRPFSRRSDKYKDAVLNALGALYGEDKVKVVSTPWEKKKNAPKRLKSVNRTEPEYAIQIELVAWLRSKNIPVIMIANEGKRSIAQNVKFKAMGLWPGASDLIIPCSNGRFNAFFIELKSKGKKPRPTQQEFMRQMKLNNNHAAWFDNVNDAKSAIKDYFGETRDV